MLLFIYRTPDRIYTDQFTNKSSFYDIEFNQTENGVLAAAQTGRVNYQLTLSWEGSDCVTVLAACIFIHVRAG